jgi:1,4-dihydroxy-2-naphthoyl-CoA synthase
VRHQSFHQTLTGVHHPRRYTSFHDVREQMRQLAVGSSSDAFVSSHDDGHGIVTLTLHNPVKHNALTPRMMIELGDVIDELEQQCKGPSELFGLIVTGEGPSFCAGLGGQ